MDLKEFAKIKKIIQKIEALAKDRFDLNKRYSDYCDTCTPQEYQEFLNSRSPNHRIYLGYVPKRILGVVFHSSAKFYLQLILQCKTAISPLLKEFEDNAGTRQTIAAKLDFEISTFLFIIQTNYKKTDSSVLVMKKVVQAGLRERRNEGYYPPVQQLIHVVFPEYSIMAQLENLVKQITSEIGITALETYSAVHEEFEDNSSGVMGLFMRANDLADCGYNRAQAHKDSILSKTELLSFIDQTKLNAVVSQLESVNTLSTIYPDKKSDDLFQVYFKRFHVALFRQNVLFNIRRELNSLEKNALNLKKAQSQLVKQDQTQEVTLQQDDVQISVALDNLQLTENDVATEEQQQKKWIEQVKLDAVEAQNAAAKVEREVLREVKKEMYRAAKKAQEDEAAAETEEEEGEAAGPTLNLFELSGSNFDILNAVFREEHLTITFPEITKLIKALGGNVSNTDGSGVKITLKKVNIFTFDAESTVTGIHLPHGAAHNNKKLIRPIIHKIMLALERAGFTPETCRARGENPGSQLKAKLGI